MKDAQIFLVNGKIKSGKDAICEHAKQWLETQGKTCIILKQANAVKKAVGGIMNIRDVGLFENRDIKNKAVDILGGYTPRQAMQLIGQGVRNLNPNFWGEILAMQIKKIKNRYDYIFISDWRFHDEKNCICYKEQIEMINLHSIRIERCKEQTMKLTAELIETSFKSLRANMQIPLTKYEADECVLMAEENTRRIMTDISETALDDRVKGDYFDLVLPNPNDKFEETKSTFIEYIKNNPTYVN